MSQQQVKLILKKNPQSYMSTKEVADLVGCSFQTVNKTLKKLATDKTLETKTIIGKTNKSKILYKYNVNDDVFAQTVHDFKVIRNKQEFEMTNSDTIRDFMIITELKKMREVMNNGNKQ